MMIHQHIQRVCYFGDYDLSYARIGILIKSLNLQGVEIIQCRVSERIAFFPKCLELFRRYSKIGQHDAVVIGFTETRWLPLFARLIVRKPLLWDMGYSIYDNWVFDRKLVPEGSFKARYYWFLDWFMPRIVDRVILPTNATAHSMTRMFGINPRKFTRVIIGADMDMFMPRSRTEDGMFRVEFHGKYIPVQGADVLVHAAKILEKEPDIHFTMIGDGQERTNVERLARRLALTNLDFIEFSPAQEIVRYIAEAHVCIGLIGDNPRVEYSIPHKLYEAAAMERVSLNSDSEGVREFFEDGKNIILVRRGDPNDVAAKILMLKNNPTYRLQLEKGAYELSQRLFSINEIGKKFVSAIEETMVTRVPRVRASSARQK